MPDLRIHTPNAEKKQAAHHKHGIVIAGFDRPEMIDEVLAEHPVSETGFETPIYVLAPISPVINPLSEGRRPELSSRVKIFEGEHCVDSMLHMLRRQLDCFLPRHIIASGHQMIPVAQQASAGIGRLASEQSQRIDAVQSVLAQRWAGRGMGHWHSRFAELRDGTQARVLVFTTRFSTFMRHAANDLVESFQCNGHDARLLCEPSAHTNITSLLCLQAIEEFDPDLIVVLNFTRAMHPELFPEGWPHVCWTQDAMGHFFQNKSAVPSPLDFIAGHIYKGAAALNGYPEESKIAFPIPVSESKFRPEPIDESSEPAARFVCDIAYVSHQSMTPDAFHEDFIQDIHPDKRCAFERCRSDLEASIDRWSDGAEYYAFLEIGGVLASEIGRSGDQSIQDLVTSQYIHPLAERILRHQTLEWAAGIAREHDLDFRIFGKGWDQHPTLAGHAHGELDHGEDLRACYQLAKVHLHASVNGAGHQRVHECAMSGGLPLCRRSWIELFHQDWVHFAQFMGRQLPHDACLVSTQKPLYLVERHAELKRAIEYRSGFCDPPAGWYRDAIESMLVIPNQELGSGYPHSIAHWCGIPEGGDSQLPSVHLRPLEILGDPFELTFSTYEDLERRVLRAVEDSHWRSSSSAGVAGRARRLVSMNHFADHLLERVTDRIATNEHAGVSEVEA